MFVTHLHADIYFKKINQWRQLWHHTREIGRICIFKQFRILNHDVNLIYIFKRKHLSSDQWRNCIQMYFFPFSSISTALTVTAYYMYATFNDIIQYYKFDIIKFFQKQKLRWLPVPTTIYMYTRHADRTFKKKSFSN